MSEPTDSERRAYGQGFRKGRSVERRVLLSTIPTPAPSPARDTQSRDTQSPTLFTGFRRYSFADAGQSYAGRSH